MLIMHFIDIQHYNDLHTIHDLRQAIAKNPNYSDNTDILEWKLFYLGLELDDDEAKLESLSPDLTKKPYINLVEPAETIRGAFDRRHNVITDKTRFLVRGSRDEFDVTAIRPGDIHSYECPMEFYFFGRQKFGIISNVELKNNEKDRKIECEIYELPMNNDGHILLWEDPTANKPAEVQLVTDQDRFEYKILQSQKKSEYEEKKMRAKNTHIGEIIDVITGHS